MATKLPFSKPEFEYKAPEAPELDEEKTKMLEEFLNHFNSESLTLPTCVNDWKEQQKPSKGSWLRPLSATETKEVTLESLSDHEKCWLTREGALRFLRAMKWSLPAAIARAEETIVWRREYKMDDPGFHALAEPESKEGRQFTLGFDRSGQVRSVN